MKKDYFISIALDTRRKLKDGSYPVKLRVFTPYPRIQKLYSTKFRLTKKEFSSIWETVKPLDKHKGVRREIQAVLDRAEDVANSMEVFTHEGFERFVDSYRGVYGDVFFYYLEKLLALGAVSKFHTAENYRSSRGSIKAFVKYERGKVPKRLEFREITPDFLDRYEHYMLNNLGRAQTTVGFYLRPLRALFNQAIEDKAIKSEIYPFKKGRYVIPSPRSVKKALSQEQLRTLYNSEPKTKSQQLAKDYWFFLYNNAGINIKDLAHLRYENLQGDKLIYVREKTKKTAKADSLPVLTFVNEYSQEFIKKHGNEQLNPRTFIFSIISDEMSDDTKHMKVKNFTRLINKNIKKIAVLNGLPKEITSYWSRHTYATNSMRNGATLEQIQQAFNHKDITTTLNYFAGFEDDTMRGIANGLMDFNSEES